MGAEGALVGLFAGRAGGRGVDCLAGGDEWAAAGEDSTGGCWGGEGGVAEGVVGEDFAHFGGMVLE